MSTNFSKLCRSLTLALLPAQLTSPELVEVAVSKPRGFSLPGHSANDQVMAKRADSMQRMLQVALNGLRLGAADAKEAGLLLWCAAASATPAKSKAVSDRRILLRIAEWDAVATGSGNVSPAASSAAASIMQDTEQPGVEVVLLSQPTSASSRTPAAAPAPAAPAASSWDPFADMGGEEEEEEEEDDAWSSIHRSNTALQGRTSAPQPTPIPAPTGTDTQPPQGSTRSRRGGGIRRSNSSRSALRPPPASGKRRGLAGTTTQDASTGTQGASAAAQTRQPVTPPRSRASSAVPAIETPPGTRLATIHSPGVLGLSEEAGDDAFDPFKSPPPGKTLGGAPQAPAQAAADLDALFGSAGSQPAAQPQRVEDIDAFFS